MIAPPVNPTFLENMRQLWRHDPVLAQRIDELPLDASLHVAPSKAGPPTAAIRTPDGRTLSLHSRYDPAREAADYIPKAVEGEVHAVVLCGLGMGHHLRALADRFGDDLAIIVIEPDPVTIKTCLEHTDLSKQLAAGRVEFLIAPDKTRLHERLSRHATLLMLGTTFVVPPFVRALPAEPFAACRQAILDFVNFAKMSLTTLIRNGVVTARNITCNLPTYIATPSIDVLHRRFEGCPAVLVAAGPSLGKNIDRLRDLQDRVVIIAAQTTLRPLLDRGIKPHFVTALDYSDLSRQFFENVNLPDDLVLVAEPKAAWSVVDAFRGALGPTGRRVVLLDNVFAHHCIGESLARRTRMEAGATVMHLAFYLADWLGCDPIVFIGQDLGFSGYVYYTPGVAVHRAWQPELGRYGTLEQKEWERIARNRKILRKVQDTRGREMYTDDQMFTYLEQFERDIARTATRVIDATEGGARIGGTDVMSLDEVAATFATRPLDAARFEYLSRSWFDAARLTAARGALRARRDELANFRALCEATRDRLATLETLVDDTAAFNRALGPIDDLRMRVRRHETIFRMVRDITQAGELQKFAADRRISAEGISGSERARRQLQRDRRSMETLLAGCDDLANIFDQALQRFDRAIAEAI